MAAMTCVGFGIHVWAHTNQPLEFREAKNLIPGDSSFETGSGILLGGEESRGRTEIVANECWDGKQSLKVDGMVNSAIISLDDNKNYAFSLYARGESNNVKALLGLVSGVDWRYSAHKNIVLGDKWARYEIILKAKKSPYRLSFALSANSGAVWLDAFQLEEGERPTAYRNSSPVNVGSHIPSNDFNYVFYPDENIRIDFTVHKAWQEVTARGGRFSYRISDFLGKTVKEVEKEIAFDNGGSFRETLLFKPEKLGLFIVRSQFKSGELSASNLISFAVVKPPVEIADGLEHFCGLNWLNPGFLGPKRIGADWIECVETWSNMNPEKGKINFDDKILTRKKQGYKKATITLWLGGIPKWTCDADEISEVGKSGLSCAILPATEHLGDWRNFVHEMAVHYKDVVDIWEIGGEDDLIWGQNSYYRTKYPEFVTNSFVLGPVADRMAEMVTIAAQEISNVNPKARIGAIRPSGSDCAGFGPDGWSKCYTFSREIFKRAGKEFNVFPLDCYCFPPRYLGPEKDQPEKALPLEYMLTNTLARANALAREYGTGQPMIYISEFGYWLDINEPPDSKYALEIVKRLSRTFLIARATPNLLFCRWFMIQGSRDIPEYEAGIWRDGFPFPTVPAFSAVARIVENVVESKMMDLGLLTKAVVFRKSWQTDGVREYIRRIFNNTDKAVGAVWMIKGAGKITIASSEAVSVSDVMGNPVQPELSGNEMTFAIGEFPVYLGMSGRNSFEKLDRAIATAKLHIAPLEMIFTTPRIDKGVLYLRNLVNQDLKANVSLEIRDKTLTKEAVVPVKKTVSVDISLAGDMKKDTVKVDADCGSGFEKVVSIFPVEFEKCPKTALPVKIDGDLSEWNGMPCILMNESGQLRPPDWIQTKWSGTNDLSANVYVGWDATNFYLAAEVTDDKHFNKKTDPDIWNGDAIRFAFDPQADGSLANDGYGADDYEFAMALTKNGKEVYEYAGPVKDAWKKIEAIVVRDEAGKKTVYEAKIPWNVLKIKPAKGIVFGFNFVIPDDDEGAGQTYWYQLSDGIANGKRPGMFKKFALTE